MLRTLVRSRAFAAMTLAGTLAWAEPAQAFFQHGNFCGADNNHFDRPPVSAVDAACRNHDLCYLRPGGMDACICDRMLVDDANNIIAHCKETNDPAYLPCGKGFARLIVTGFTLKPCQNNQTIAPGSHSGWFWPFARSSKHQ